MHSNQNDEECNVIYNFRKFITLQSHYHAWIINKFLSLGAQIVKGWEFFKIIGLKEV